MTIRNLDQLFRPKSVAVIGASARAGSLGNIVFQNVTSGGFQGTLYAVNPKGGTIAGVAVHTRLADLPVHPLIDVLAARKARLVCGALSSPRTAPMGHLE
jgi:acetyltransferase